MKTIDDKTLLGALYEAKTAQDEVENRAGQLRVAQIRLNKAVDRLGEIRHAEENWKFEDDAPYGLCPLCGAKGVTRERRPNGNDKCAAGHVYPSRDGTTDEAST